MEATICEFSALPIFMYMRVPDIGLVVQVFHNALLKYASEDKREMASSVHLLIDEWINLFHYLSISSFSLSLSLSLSHTLTPNTTFCSFQSTPFPLFLFVAMEM